MKMGMVGLMAVVMPLMALPTLRAQSFAEPRDGRIDRIQRREQRLIREQFRAGEVTPHEFRRLETEQARINRQEERAESDGRLTLNERRHLRTELRHARRRIYRAAHN